MDHTKTGANDSNLRASSTVLEFAIDQYPESCIRKSLYWLSELAEWQLNTSKTHWIITLSGDDEALAKSRSHLNRLLNDFMLRDRLDRSTRNLREKIVQAALERIAYRDS